MVEIWNKLNTIVLGHPNFIHVKWWWWVLRNICALNMIISTIVSCICRTLAVFNLEEKITWLFLWKNGKSYFNFLCNFWCIQMAEYSKGREIWIYYYFCTKWFAWQYYQTNKTPSNYPWHFRCKYHNTKNKIFILNYFIAT